VHLLYRAQGSVLGLIAEGRSTRICNRSQPVQFDGDTVDPTNRLAVEIDPSSLTLAVPEHHEDQTPPVRQDSS
jgi:hypothetical protein